MTNVFCKFCKKGFYAKPFWIKRGWGVYCSKECQNKGQKSGKYLKCFVCKKEIYKALSKLEHSKSKKHFCSKSCQTQWRNITFIGDKHGNWKGGTHSYRNILFKNKDAVCNLCKTTDKRILAVHHLDHNRKNNKVENLVFLCHNCHHLVHHDRREEENLLLIVKV